MNKRLEAALQSASGGTRIACLSLLFYIGLLGSGLLYAGHASAATPDSEAHVNLSGRVLEAGSRDPLEGVSVALEGTGLSITTDEEGRFAFANVPPGSVFIQITLPGYESLREAARILEGKQTLGMYYLRRPADHRYALEVTTRREGTEVIQHSLTMDEVRSTPGTFGDAIRAVQNLPGVARAPFGLGLLIVRGTGPNDSGTYLDGLRVPIIFHFGGLISVYSSSILDRIDYLPGGYSARYGRTLGGVIDVETRDAIPERTHGYLDVNLLDSSLFLEGRIGQLGYSVSGRRSYIDVLANPLLERLQGLQVQFPRYWDGQIKLDYHMGSSDRFQLLLTGSDDRYAILGNASGAQNQDSAQSAGFSSYTTTLRAKASWSHRFNATASNRLDISFGPDDQNTQFGSGEIRQHPVWLYARDEANVTLLPWLKLRGGMDLQASHYQFDIEMPAREDSGQDATSIHQEAWSISPSPYLEADLSFADRLKIIPGIRWDPLDIPGQYTASSLDPRLALRFKLNDRALLKGSFGRYSQSPETNQVLADTGTPDLKPEHALQSTLGFELDVTHQLHLDAVGYYNALSSLVVSGSGGGFGGMGLGQPASSDSPRYTNDGLGRNYGLEMLLRQDFGSRFYGWVSYTLSRAERKDTADDAWRLYAFDQTHILTLVGGYRLSRGWEISSRYRFASGNPYTPVVNSYQDLDSDRWTPIQGAESSARNEPFSQLDVRVQKEWIYNRWKLQAYLDIQNITNRSNPESTIYNFDFRDSSVISGLPILPVLGFRGSF